MVHLANNAQEHHENRKACEKYPKMLVSFFTDYLKQLNNTASPSFGLGCSGIDILGPRTRIDNNKFVMTVKLSDEVAIDPKYCDNILGNEYLTNPYMIKQSMPFEYAEIKKKLR